MTSERSKPLVSIITAVLNGEKCVGQTIKSVAEQSYPNIEYIIIDGGSSDNTLKIIKENETSIDKWVSENDAGMYDAMNKGVAMARGEYIGILNSDDWYHKDTVSYVVDAFTRDSRVGLVHGDMNVFDEHGRFIKTVSHSNYPIKRLISTPFKHPTCFVKKAIYSKYGGFNTKYRLAADYEFMLRCVNNKVKSKHIRKVITSIRQVGVTTSTSEVSAPHEIADILTYYTGSALAGKVFVQYRKLRTSLRNSLRQ